MQRSSFTNQGIGLLCSLCLSFLAGYIGGIAAINAPEFYGQLLRPTWTPPAWVFGPVWSVLFTLMATSAWLVWRKYGFSQTTATAFVLYAVQLAVNALWSWLFFAWSQGLWALVDVLVLWVLVAATIGYFWRLSRLAALLLVPYLVWLSLAMAMNYTLWRLNPNLLA